MNGSTIWWREYRKRQNKPNPRNLSVEYVVRKTFRRVLKEYVNSCSLGGVQQMCDPNISFMQRIIRISFFCLMFGGIVYFLINLFYGNLANPLIVVMESSTYPVSNIKFPSVSICNFNRISKKALEKYVTKFQQYINTSKYKGIKYQYLRRKYDVKTLMKQMHQLGRLIDFSYNKSLVNYDLLVQFLKTLDIHKVMEELAPSCDEMLLNCSWAGKIENCSTIFDVQSTVRGHCCAFNHILKYNSTKRYFSSVQNYQIRTQQKPGHENGLNIMMDAMIEDYSYPLYNMFGFEVLIFDSSNFGDPTSGRMVQRLAQPGYATIFEIKSVKQVATHEVRKYPAKIRKCFFHDELKEKFGDMYSFSYCIMQCRIKAIQSLCKCTPFFFPVTNSDVPICDINDLRCLNKHKEKMTYLYPLNPLHNEGLENELEDALRCSECLPDCELTRHFTKHSKIILSRVENKDKEYIEHYFKNKTISDKALVSIYLGKKTGVLNRLDIVFYWYEIISNIGGFCGILVGFSIISLLEFLYFFVLRFSFYLCLFYVNNE